jgi:hypothetical protein
MMTIRLLGFLGILRTLLYILFIALLICAEAAVGYSMYNTIKKKNWFPFCICIIGGIIIFIVTFWAVKRFPNSIKKLVIQKKNASYLLKAGGSSGGVDAYEMS